MEKIITLYKGGQNKALDLRLMEAELRERRIKTDYAKITRTDGERKLLEEFEFKPVDASDLVKQTVRDDAAFVNRLPFVNAELSESIPLIPGHFYIVGAISGTGKTTTCAAMVHAILQDEKAKPVLVLSNEEKCVDFFGRLSCLELGIAYPDYHYRKLPAETMARIRANFEKLSKRVFFVNSSLTRSVAGLKAILQKQGVETFSAVFLDYVQGVKSIEVGSASADPVDALYALKHFITEYTMDAPVPFVAFSQLKPMAASDFDRNVESRLKWCSGMYEAAHFVIEAINVPQMMSTIFWTDKVRFGTKHQTYPCKFDKGRYIFLTPDDFEQHKAEMLAKRVESAEDFKSQLTPEDEGSES